MTPFPELLFEQRLVAILRARTPAPLVEVAMALVDGGVRCLEITLPSPGSLGAVRELTGKLGDEVAVGMGTVLSAAEVRQAADAGAGFVVSPDHNPEVVAAADELGLGSLPGAFTPTEIVAAWRGRPSAVKVFPASVLGPEFFSAVRAPLPDVPLVATGGVDLVGAASFLRHGCAAVGVGGPLLGTALDAGAPGAAALEQIRERAVAFVQVCRRVSA
ncbi:MAG TPA: bifunctional 4-hydroxy-2-oxoglutarate aldolase/2-dehydro-3-deoxy-phosphogluconate aldolase [Pseudonocardia sp.]|uniref:bifunctional 4-hydroxy-2-oxoglutarate aldolase/2-dehydro-3-deoxy-phosphogluconate aldolase n=1 Tax=Pseudonocardia sp. TaxID=60912 RepID=UPI002C3F0877|nr:bifunctional 4-hydroxy-2-oxoglutarate aldolase/2-dehydro-3-deoxy-phosphogluconate aldolase [Pseudonocardia sp.]HTF46485.1 bifunctional 4-hydroxy-2-oxoglutarate aldolase/2-dehydro-3-deoxy-phosphogluconate aldolase [Pseudonocardia sp.]